MPPSVPTDLSAPPPAATNCLPPTGVTMDTSMMASHAPSPAEGHVSKLTLLNDIERLRGWKQKLSSYKKTPDLIQNQDLQDPEPGQKQTA